MQALNPSTMPLAGVNLIEASAGTGKTYTITTLYLRLLLGLYDETTTLSGKSVDQLLVVTFTEAATEEIRERVRSRLQEMRHCLLIAQEQGTDINEGDPVLKTLLTRVSDIKAAWHQLDAAIKSLDEAAIFTIHGFCHRMLQQHAFESGSMFTETFILDESELVSQAVNDVWRQHTFDLKPAILDVVLNRWNHPEALLRDILPILHRDFAEVQPALTLSDIDNMADRYETLVKAIKSSWLTDDIPELLQQSDLSTARKPGKAAYIDAMTEFAQSDQLFFKDLGLWTTDSISKPGNLKGKKVAPVHSIFNLFDQAVPLSLDYEGSIFAWFKAMARREVKERLAIAKQKQAKLSPDDLLTRLAHALRQDETGALRKAIATQYPVALIDEFQDTDPLQYQIFSTIYQMGSEKLDTTEDIIESDGNRYPPDESNPLLIMIGDPKQAIYGFRGADIFTYIDAKTRVSDGGKYTLDTNWRSNSRLISVVNHIFQRHPSPFIFDQQIPFIDVRSAGKNDNAALTLNGSQTSVMHVWHLTQDNEVPFTRQAAMPHLAEATANEISMLLEKGRNRQAMLGKEPVKAGDLAILVRDRHEASVIRESLTRAGVASVYLSRDSIFNTDIARDLFTLLEGIYLDLDEKALKAVLLTLFFDFSVNEIWSLSEQEEQWQQQLEVFQQLRQVLLAKGVLALIQHMLQTRSLAALWKKRGLDHARLLTDLRHLGEILQAKSLELDGFHRLLGWFGKQLAEQSNGDKTQTLRLETDDNLVQIVTMHASKGLEYPIVFLPFVCGVRPAKEGIYHQGKALYLDLLNQPEGLEIAEQERLAEDLRLLYVALTRAVHRLYLGLFDLRIGNAKKSLLLDTAIGYLLATDTASKDSDRGLPDLLSAWYSSSDPELMTIEPINADESVNSAVQPEHDNAESVSSIHPMAEDLPELIDPPAFTATIQKDWRVTSYSALSQGAEGMLHKTGFDDEGDDQLVDVPDVLPEDRFGFPKGAQAGSCLHEILENISFDADEETIAEQAAQALLKYGLDEKWLAVVTGWMADVLNTPMTLSSASTEQQGHHFHLAEIRDDRRLVEMEFYLPLSRLESIQLNRIINRYHPFKSGYRFNEIQGMLKGFIDLIVEHQGVFYVIDYKSNHLGFEYGCYNEEGLTKSMTEHHYHLQYILYTLALHRYLKSVLPNYDYQQHIGGCLYLFLRGMSVDSADTGVFFNRPEQALIEALDDLFAGREPADAQPDATSQLNLFGEE